MASTILKLNVHIPPGDKSAIQELVHSIEPEWKKDSITVTPITGGVLNEVWKCSNASSRNRITVKVHGEVGDAFYDRSNEKRLFEGLHEHGLHPIRCLFDNGYAYDYIIGNTPTAQQFREAELYESLIKVLHKTHVFDYKQFGVKHCFSKYIDTISGNWTKEYMEPLVLTERYKSDFPSFEAMKEKLPILQQIYKTQQKDFPVCFTHQDMHISNTVYDPVQGTLSAVDWECSGYSPEILDIAIAISRDPNHIFEGVLPGQDEDWTRGVVVRYLQTHPAFAEQDVDEQLVEKWLDGVYEAMYLSQLCLVFAALETADKFENNDADYYRMALETFTRSISTQKIIEERKLRRTQ